MPIEVARGWCPQLACNGTLRKVQYQREAAGSPGEMYGSASVGAHRERMAPALQGQIEDVGAVRGKSR